MTSNLSQHKNGFPPIGHKRWVIAGITSHEAACILNVSDQDAGLEITIFYSDRDPAGPYKAQVPARRTKHIRFNDLTEPESIPRDKNCASVIESNVPVVVQYVRTPSRQGENSAMTAIAYADTESIM